MEKLFKKIKKEALNPDEKAKIFSALQTFVAENPIKNIPSPFYNSWFIFRYRMVMAPIAFILIFALAGSAAFAAKKSLPGDKLYSIKMLNEKVESMIAIDSKTKAQIEISHAISRLQEVEQIVTSNRQLDKGDGKKIGDNFQEQVQEATNNINELRNRGREKDASEIHSDFRTMLTEHEKTITELSNSGDTKDEIKKELDQMVSEVRSELKKKLDEDGRESKKQKQEEEEEEEEEEEKEDH